MRKRLLAFAMLLGIVACTDKEVKQTDENEKNMITYHKIQVEDCQVFYCEAGSAEKPAILLLHGFPSSSHMYRELMPELADEYHLIAPDFPSFGQTESPERITAIVSQNGNMYEEGLGKKWEACRRNWKRALPVCSPSVSTSNIRRARRPLSLQGAEDEV